MVKIRLNYFLIINYILLASHTHHIILRTYIRINIKILSSFPSNINDVANLLAGVLFLITKFLPLIVSLNCNLPLGKLYNLALVSFALCVRAVLES